MPFYRVRHAVKPGLTGWSQVMYRYGASLQDSVIKLQHDLYYVKHQSVLLDLHILLKDDPRCPRLQGAVSGQHGAASGAYRVMTPRMRGAISVERIARFTRRLRARAGRQRTPVPTQDVSATVGGGAGMADDSELPGKALAFAEVLEAKKREAAPPDFPWYPYGTIHNFGRSPSFCAARGARWPG